MSVNQNNSLSMIEHFSIIEDPRIQRCRKYELVEILVMTMCAVICNCDTWIDVEFFCRERIDWFRKFFKLPYGTPSHDTFGRVFSLVNPQQFNQCFCDWINTFHRNHDGEIINIDGKTLTGSGNRLEGIKMVSAWAVESNIVLGQLKTKDGPNEITTIPDVLSLLEIKNCIITIDAIGCQKNIAKEIIDKKGDYVLALKKNQKTLHKKVINIFDGKVDYNADSADTYETTEMNKGRFENRRYTCLPTNEFDHLNILKSWKNFNTIIKVESLRKYKNKTTTQDRYYISSLPAQAKKIAKAVRGHWAIENNLHWALDVSFNEDKFKGKKGYSGENLAAVRRMALNIIKKDPTGYKAPMRRKRVRCMINESYFEQVLWGI